MTHEMKHSRAPWSLGGYENLTLYGQDDSDGDPLIIGGLKFNGHFIPFCESVYCTPKLTQQRANALRIVKCVNCHDELLDALKDAEDHLEYCGYGDKWERECAREDGLAEKIEKAIAKATNE